MLKQNSAIPRRSNYRRIQFRRIFSSAWNLGRDGKPADAAGQFREAVRIMPDLPEARFNLGLALVNERKYS